jgi:hypothetical protein
VQERALNVLDVRAHHIRPKVKAARAAKAAKVKTAKVKTGAEASLKNPWIAREMDSTTRRKVVTTVRLVSSMHLAFAP